MYVCGIYMYVCMHVLMNLSLCIYVFMYVCTVCM